MAQEAPQSSEASEALSHPSPWNKRDLNHDDDYPSSESDVDVSPQVYSALQPLLPPTSKADDHHKQTDHHVSASRTRTRATTTSTMPIRKRRTTKLKKTEIVWVSLTLLLISILGYSSQLCIMLPYYRKTPSFELKGLLAVLVPFNLGLFAIFYNYALCVWTDPGGVPAGWEPEWQALDPVTTSQYQSNHGQPLLQQQQESAGKINTNTDSTFTTTSASGATSLEMRREMQASLELKHTIYRPRYCKTCLCFKPPRAHHCKTCHRCILRMDHHCPWVANCVGFHNYTYFLGFLFFVDFTCLYHLIMISCRVLDRFNSWGYWREPSGKELVWLVMNYTLCIPVLILVGIFSIYHFYCVTVNQTTIESWEKDRVAIMIRRGRIRKVKYPYNLGMWSNVKSVFGEKWWWWCFPFMGKQEGGMQGDGLKYAVVDGLDQGAQYRWPPKDPTKITPVYNAHASNHTVHSWREDAKQAPQLFASTPSSLLPPGASSTSPFTYGASSFNPNLRPTNSSSLRYRGDGGGFGRNDEDQDKYGYMYREEGMSDYVSTDSDDDNDNGDADGGMGGGLSLNRSLHFAAPSAIDLDQVDGYHDHSQLRRDYDEYDLFQHQHQHQHQHQQREEIYHSYQQDDFIPLENHHHQQQQQQQYQYNMSDQLEPIQDLYEEKESFSNHNEEKTHDNDYEEERMVQSDQTRVLIRRGSEGYEVRPRAKWLI
ncbi:related to PFA4 - Palmitoyltransferase [Melanopsichium pennsylvanicum]|uniref:Palmitoyltransferase PFA4 n=1 Tax=Melanopsichium pennsylvanicum TaxID=63383 RepID=A0AAJ4XIZ2_9BASI|nr:related to PFA4 - Palmitoyltransferase [Melanopsichium pennsylvanicum]